MPVLRIAILGAGAIADSHIKAYQALAGQCQIVALVDLYPDKAKAKAARYGLQAAVFRDCQELLRGIDFDGASVCLPPFEHAPATLALLQAGKHVLVEKPMATSLQEADDMLAAARASGRQLSVIAQNRFQTPVARLKRVLQSGLAGKILHAQADSFWWRGDRYYDLWWRGTWEKEGGGCTMNHAVHHVDLYLWLMGMPTAVQSVTANLAHDNSEVEDFSTTVLFHPEGSVGQLTASLVHHGESQQLVFQGEHAQVAVPWQVRASRQKENGFPERDAERERKIQAFYEGLPALAVEGHNAQIANFIAAIRSLEPLAVDGAAGRRTVELITAIYQSGQSGVRVSLPLEASSPFYSRDRLLRQVRHFHEKTKNVANFSTDEITLGRNLGR